MPGHLFSATHSFESRRRKSMSETPQPLAETPTTPAPTPFAERFSDGLQSILQKILGTQRQSPRRLKSLLNGVWLGHPLHPLLTDIPIAAWTITALFDIIWLISRSSWAASGAFVTVIVGILAALAAAVTGLTDWSDTYGSE